MKEKQWKTENRWMRNVIENDVRTYGICMSYAANRKHNIKVKNLGW